MSHQNIDSNSQRPLKPFQNQEDLVRIGSKDIIEKLDDKQDQFNEIMKKQMLLQNSTNILDSVQQQADKLNPIINSCQSVPQTIALKMPPNQEIELRINDAPIEGQEQIISPNNQFQTPQILTPDQSKQVAVNQQRPKVSIDVSSDQGADSVQAESEDIDIINIMQENQSETEKSHNFQKQSRSSTQTFKKHQTKILQKWFLDNIQHPYLKKDDKSKLAEETGLTKKQITGWFTNNRKRKYQKVAVVAKKKNKDFAYVREIIKMKFDKDLDQSLSSDQNCADTDSRKQAQVSQFANKLWGNINEKQILLGQPNEQMSVYETMQGPIDHNQNRSIQKPQEMETKPSQPQVDIKDSRINLNEFIGKRMANNGELRNFSTTNSANLGGEQFQLQQKNLIDSSNYNNMSAQRMLDQAPLKQQVSERANGAPIDPIANMKNSVQPTTGLQNAGSHFTFNGTFDNLTPRQTQPQQQQDQKQAMENIRDNENAQAQKILENLQRIFCSQKAAQGKDNIKGQNGQNALKHANNTADTNLSNKNRNRSRSQKSVEPTEHQQNSVLSQKIKYIPILYVKCPEGSQSQYEPLFDLRQQINQYLEFFFKQRAEKSGEVQQENNENSENEGMNASEKTSSNARQHQITQIEGYVDNFIKTVLNQSQQSGFSPLINKETLINKFASLHNATNQASQNIKNPQPSDNGSQVQPTQTSQLSQKDLDIKQLLLSTFKGSSTQAQTKIGTCIAQKPDISNIANNAQINAQINSQQNNKFQTFPKPHEGSQLFQNNVGQAAQELNEKRGIENFFKLCNQTSQIKKTDSQGNNQSMISGQKPTNSALIQQLQQMEGAQNPGNTQNLDAGQLLGQKWSNISGSKNQAGQVQSQNNSAHNNASMFMVNGSNSMNSGLGFAGSVNIGYPSSNSNQCNNSRESGSNGSKNSQQHLGQHVNVNGSQQTPTRIDQQANQSQNDATLKIDKQHLSHQHHPQLIQKSNNLQVSTKNKSKLFKAIDTPEAKKFQKNMLSGQDGPEHQQSYSDGQHQSKDSNKMLQPKDTPEGQTIQNSSVGTDALANQGQQNQKINNGNILNLLESFFKTYNVSGQMDAATAGAVAQSLKSLIHEGNNAEQILGQINSSGNDTSNKQGKKSGDQGFQNDSLNNKQQNNNSFQQMLHNKLGAKQQMQMPIGDNNMIDQMNTSQLLNQPMDQCILNQAMGQMQNQQQQPNMLQSSPNYFSQPTNSQFQNFMSQINAFNQPQNMNNFDGGNCVMGSMPQATDMIGMQNMQMNQGNGGNQIGYKNQYPTNQVDQNQASQLLQQGYLAQFNSYQNVLGAPGMEMPYQQQKHSKDKSRQRGGSNHPDRQSEGQFNNLGDASLYMSSTQMENNQQQTSSYPGQQHGYYHNMHQQQ